MPTLCAMTDIASDPRRVPEKPSLEGLEPRWSQKWQEEGTYAFDRSKERADVYAIDTPPPTVSGNLHIGHVYSFTHTDTIARFQRMRGKAVFYPIGWDDNGLPTERRVQRLFGVKCDPSLPYDPEYALQSTPDSANPVPIPRRNFIGLCARQTRVDEEAYERLWRRLGLSYDWSYHYTTVSPASQRVAQVAFLRNLARGEAYTAEAPSLWDVSFGTAVAQAELEFRDTRGAYHRLRFDGPDGPLEIDTTRPELLAACVALICHPDDERFSGLVGRMARTPVFGAEVPILAHPTADPEKGTGLVMVCTFGDLTDVTWWRDLSLDTRVIVGRDGRLLATGPTTVDAHAYAQIAGLTVEQARRQMVGLLRERGALVGDPRPITHPVSFYEKGDRPLEIVSSRQWYIRNGGRDPGLRAELIQLGRQLRWVPDHMRHRYESWVNGLTGDWIISRQRYLGPPFPVWYRLDGHGVPDYDHPLTPDESRLPIDPWVDRPDGYDEGQRGQPNGFIGDPDVMDTWATSSMSPQIAGGWLTDPDLFARVFPFDLRAQAHEIIRTWLFSTVVRSRAEHGVLPWHTADISGWIVENRLSLQKISKSLGAGGPEDLLDRYGSDAVRYWAATGRPGVDTTFDEAEVKVGRRLAVKLLNAARFVLGLAAPDPSLNGPAAVTEPLDLALLARLERVVRTTTAALEGYDHTGALEATEAFFWEFCDDYVELVKERAYGDGPLARSARATLSLALDVQARLLAPFLPYVTEEVWSWFRAGSVHRAAWPRREEFPTGGDEAVLTAISAALTQIRRAKSDRHLSMRASFASAQVRGPSPELELIRAAADDLRAAGRIGKFELHQDAAPLAIVCSD